MSEAGIKTLDECGCGHIHSQSHDHKHDHEHEDCHCDSRDHVHNHNHGHEECHCDGHIHDHGDGYYHEETYEPVTTKSEQKVYILENLQCANCAAKMEQKIRELPGVEMAGITFATKQLRVAADHQENLLPQIQKICTSIERDVTVTLREETRVEKGRSKTGFFAEHTKEVLSIAGGAVLFVAGEILERTAADPMAASIAFIIAYILLGWEIVWTAAKNISKGRIFDENFLMSIATLAAFAIGDYAEAVGVMLFYRVGELFEHAAVERSRSQIMDAVDMRPEVVNLVVEGDVSVIPAQDAKIGDIVMIRPGDRIPLDGTVTEGESRVDTSPVTGEPVPVTVKKGSSLISGCVNEQGLLKMQVEKPLSESMVTKILDSVENAAASKPKLDRFITKFARIYTPIVVLAALATAVIPSLVTGDWNHWIYTAITFLVISCPCALVLSVPLAFFSGIGAGSKRGILFKGGVSIEALKDIRAVVMDKTGTITKGEFRVQRVVPKGNVKMDEVLAMAAECEQSSTHPIGISIVEAARERNLLLKRPEEAEEIAGKGIRAQIDSKEVLCGNRALMELFHVNMSGYTNDQYGTEVLIACNGKLAGYLVIADAVKEDAKPSVQFMKKLHLITAMLTGDTKESAEAVAREVGIDEVHAQLLPQDKLNRLQQIRRDHGSVLFVGDGINDAPVLAGADVGAAMGSGADAAIEAADVVFMTSAVNAIPESIQIAQATGKIAMQNVIVALAVKALVIVLGFLGFANMWMAVFADTGVAMLCVLNSIRVLYRKF